MKKQLTFALAATIAASMGVSALAADYVNGIEHCFYNYDCYKSTNTVKIDGVYDAAEWADAETLVIDNDHMNVAGRWQSAGDPLSAADLSCTYKFKWDDDYFYLLEVRTDSHYVSNFQGKDYDPNNPRRLDGTALFLCDNEIADQSNRCDIKWYSYVDELKGPTASVAGVNVNDVSGARMAGSVNGNTIVFELRLPWSVFDAEGKLASAITEGKLFRFTPIIMSRDSIEDYDQWDGSTTSYRQINFHDCMNLPDENPTSTEAPNFWASITLCGTNPAAVTTSDGTTAAPATFDAVIVPVALALASFAGIVISKKH